jgi:hypothetical protein
LREHAPAIAVVHTHFTSSSRTRASRLGKHFFAPARDAPALASERTTATCSARNARQRGVAQSVVRPSVAAPAERRRFTRVVSPFFAAK